jgi:hypothetical protein
MTVWKHCDRRTKPVDRRFIARHYHQRGDSINLTVYLSLTESAKVDCELVMCTARSDGH